MTQQMTRFTIWKSTEVVWDDKCTACDDGSEFIADNKVSQDESRLVIYLECGSCGAMRTLTIDPVTFSFSADGAIIRMEV